VIGSVFAWWLAITALGLAGLPLAHALFARLPGHGLGLARPLGLLLVSYLLWLGATLRLIPNTLTGILAAAALLVLLSAWLALRPGGSLPAILTSLRARGGWLLAGEVLFALALLGWAALRAHTMERIMPTGGEKFMEMAFFSSILRSPSFPPPDPWLSGYSISYYYFGYVMMAVMTRLTGASAGAAFDLYNALLFALTVQAAYSLAAEMAVLAGMRAVRASLTGLCAALFTAGLGNLAGLLEALNARGWLPSGLAAWFAIPDFPAPPAAPSSLLPAGSWWWWRASRVIQDLDLSGRPLPVSPITEFPFFSFLLGDNHPHVLALPFILLAIAIALDWLQAGLRLGRARLAAAALLLGSLAFLNTWDYPVYFALALTAFLAGEYSRAGALSRRVWFTAGLRGLALGAGALVFYLPFWLLFDSQAGGLLPYLFPPTRLPQYLLIFAPFVLILGFFLVYELIGLRLKPANLLSRVGGLWLRLGAALLLGFALLTGAAGLYLQWDAARGGSLLRSLQPVLGAGSVPQILGTVFLARLTNPWLVLLLSLLLALGWTRLRAARQPNPARSFALLLALFGLALTLSVELIYLRDGFGLRMNTVFKFYFQSWVLLALSSAFGLSWLLGALPRGPRLALALAAGLLSAAALVYPLLAIPSRAAWSTPPVLDAAVDMRRANPADWAAIDWLQTQVQPGQQAVLLEAPCASYCYGGRISAFSGIPTVLGWYAHELQWRGSSLPQAGRQSDIAAIYTSADDARTLDLLRKWRVTHVVFGEYEREYIRGLCAADCSPEQTSAKLERILTPLFQQDGLTLYAVPPPD